ncbi:hypothetical protein BGZ60DRAFT_179099 [Tricladium varicosporioides]|nr:hypothetical protein BGZ60DRAFT_179099 [Hymenoscyphus varicosporioides]
MDPLSITTGVLGLIGVCFKVSSSIKDLYDGAAIADTKVKGLLTDVESFSQVLQLMKDTFEQDQVQDSFQTTGHIGNHWNSLSVSIQDGQKTLVQLQETLEKVNKSVSVLDGPRKHLRLKAASDEIGIFQLQIRSYRDTLQLSLQTVILWNQVNYKVSADKILPNLDELNQAIRRIALDINSRMSNLQSAVESKASKDQFLTLKNLRNCVQSAASVVSSASTTLGVENVDRSNGSEFGDCFPPEPGETMLRWISSNTVYEFEQEPTIGPSSRRHNLMTGDLQSIDDSTGSEQSDSDNDLELEISQALMKLGKEKFQAKDFEAAERIFRNCLTRLSSNLSLTSLHYTPQSKLGLMNLLLDVYLAQEKWDDAQSLILEKIALGSRGKSRDDGQVLNDILALVDILLHKNSYAEALLYGRRALKGYRRMGSDGVLGVKSSLKALVRICHMSGNYDEEDAYAVILSDFLQLNSSHMSLTDGTQSSEQHVTSVVSTSLVLGGKQSHHQTKQQESASNIEPHHSNSREQDMDVDQISRALEKTNTTTKDNIVQRHSIVMPSTITNPPHFPSNETKEKDPEGTSTTDTTLFKLNKTFRTMPEMPSPLTLISGMLQNS